MVYSTNRVFSIESNVAIKVNDLVTLSLISQMLY